MLKISFSWDDGAPEDLKLVSLFEKYSIPCKLFVPSKNREGRKTLSSEDIKALSSELISFGGHTYSHVYLTELSVESAKKEVLLNVEYLENILGKKIEHFCFPGGQYTVDLLKEIQDEFVSLRTADTMCSSFQGKLRKPTFHFYPRGYKSLFGNALRNKDKIFFSLMSSINKTNYFSTMKKVIINAESSVYDYHIHVWGHSWEIDELQLWSVLEDFLCFIKTNYYKNISFY